MIFEGMQNEKIIIVTLTLLLLVSCSDTKELAPYTTSSRAEDEADIGFLSSSGTGFCEYRGLGTDDVILWCQSFKSSHTASGNYDSSMNNYYISVPLDGSEAKVVSEFHR